VIVAGRLQRLALAATSHAWPEPACRKPSSRAHGRASQELSCAAGHCLRADRHLRAQCLPTHTLKSCHNVRGSHLSDPPAWWWSHLLSVYLAVEGNVSKLLINCLKPFSRCIRQHRAANGRCCCETFIFL